jgi:voltage-gated potassium channel Kch
MHGAARAAAASCAAINPGAEAGAIPEKLSVSVRAMVTLGYDEYESAAVSSAVLSLGAIVGGLAIMILGVFRRVAAAAV